MTTLREGMEVNDLIHELYRRYTKEGDSEAGLLADVIVRLLRDVVSKEEEGWQDGHAEGVIDGKMSRDDEVDGLGQKLYDQERINSDLEDKLSEMEDDVKTAFEEGRTEGYTEGRNEGHGEGYDEGYETGYSQGLREGEA